ncbi:uncharacterized protein LOC106664082 isoform X2 [Cimex lectularius]|nr:uncharacterized protein LOC106664082 isoform X2 [Cimex lectularius]XP_014244972.1 uncharacterized protein LOC106664082 isoform X2 [Cimex lectularius]XP_014244982.1 uncharacterized protein LOC106664082 isoform X2 [Cimex lectularius]
MSLGKKCAYATCGKYSVLNPKKSFFELPNDENLKEGWIKNAGLNHIGESESIFLCQDHFRNISFEDRNKTKLVKSAVPIKVHENKKTCIQQLCTCKYCGVLFSSMANVKRHEKECGITCVNCGLRFKDSNNYSKHKEQCLKYERKRCIVSRCLSNNTGSNNEVVPTFPLPDDLFMRNTWLDEIPICTKMVPQKRTSFVCIKHFSKDDIIKDEKGIHLKPTAIPGGFKLSLGQDKEIVKCCIPGCTSNHDSYLISPPNKPVRTFPFPRDIQAQKNKWFIAIYSKFLTKISTGSVCVLHFKDDDIIQSGEHWFLKHAAVPSIFDIKSPKSDKGLQCCVPNCSTVAKPGIGFHTFPTPNRSTVEVLYQQSQSRGNSGVISDLRQIWLDRVGLKDASPLTVICTKHFTKNDYIKGRDGSLKLVKLAVPTQGLPKPFKPCFLFSVGKEKFHNKGKSIMQSHSVIQQTNQDLPCSITYCNSHLLNLPRRMVYKLPKDITKAQKWVDICGYPQWMYQGFKAARETVRICSLHFSESMITPEGRLKFNAVPSIFDPLAIPDPLEKDVVVAFGDNQTCTKIVEEIPTTDPNINTRLILPKSSSSSSSTFPGKYVKCAVESCDNYFDESRAEYLGQSYFTFPEDPEQRLAWINAINKPVDWDPSHSRICFRHFHGIYVKDGKILKNAVPSVYLHSKTEPYPINKDVKDKPNKAPNGSSKRKSSNVTKSCVMVTLPFKKTVTKVTDDKTIEIIEIADEVKEPQRQPRGRKRLKKPRGRPRVNAVLPTKPKRKVGRPRIHPISPSSNSNKLKVGRPRKKLLLDDDINIDTCAEENEISDFAWKVETQIEEYESDFSLNNQAEEEEDHEEEKEEECRTEVPCDIRDQPQVVIIKEEPQGPSEFEASESALYEESLVPPLKKIKLEPQSNVYNAQSDENFDKTTGNKDILTEQTLSSQINEERAYDLFEKINSSQRDDAQTNTASETKMLDDEEIYITGRFNEDTSAVRTDSKTTNSSNVLTYDSLSTDITLYETKSEKKLFTQLLDNGEIIEEVVNQYMGQDPITIKDSLNTKKLELNRTLNLTGPGHVIGDNSEIFFSETNLSATDGSVNYGQKVTDSSDEEFDSFLDTVKTEFNKLDSFQKRQFMHEMRSKFEELLKGNKL